MQDELCWFLPRTHRRTQWRGLIEIFTGKLWLLSFCMFLVVLIVVYAVGRWQFIGDNTAQPIQRLDEIAMQLGSMMYGVSTSFNRRTHRQRIILFLWAMLCLNFTTAYTSGFFRVLTTRKQFEEVLISNASFQFFYVSQFAQINTVEDILSSGMEFGLSKLTLVFFMGDEEIDRTVVARNKGCESTTDCIHRVAKNHNFAMASSKMYVGQIVGRELTPIGGVSPVRFLPIPIASPPIEMILIKV